MQDNKHIKKKHLGLFAANLVEVICGRAKPLRYPSRQLFTTPQSTLPGLGLCGKYHSYSDALRNVNSRHYNAFRQQCQPQQQTFDYLQLPLLQQPPSTSSASWHLPAGPDNGNNSPVEMKYQRSLNLFLKLIQSFI